MNNVYILSAARTPIGKFGGSLASFSSADLGVVAARAAIERAGVKPEQIEETIFGSARQAGSGPNPARQISYRSRIPQESPAYTVNQACASGMKSVALAFLEIASGNMDCALAGGTEAMSRIPYLLPNARWGYRLGSSEVVDAMYQDGYNCPLSEMVMGATAENLAAQYNITRLEQDEYALCSQQRAAEAQSSGRFDDEIVPVTIESKKGNAVFSKDEHLFPEASMEKMAKLAPVFSKTGTVTAGNSSGITDGAAAMMLASEKFVRENNVKPLAKILGATSVGVDSKIMGIAPVPAVRKVEKKLGLKLGQFDLIELNEAFAAQVIACDRELHFDRDRLNVNGGAISLGHPTGCTGTRITVTLLHEMRKRKARLGLATLCVSGGLGMALAIENCM